MALPRLNFQPVVDPYVSKPIEEFGSTVGVLRKDYDEALAEENRVRQAMASIQAAPFQEEYLQRANEELQQALGQVAEKGDYERQRSFIKQATNKYLSRALPIQQAGEQYRQFAEQATRLGVDPRVLEYVKRQETKNPSIKEVDGYTFNTFDISQYQRFLRPEPNITEELTEIGSAVQAELRKRDQLGVLGARTEANALPTDIPVKIGEQTKWVDRNEVEALMRERSQDSDIKSYLENQKLLVQSEIEEDLFSDYIEMGFDPQEARLKAQQESKGIAAQQVQQDLQSTIDVAGDALSYKQIAQTFNPFNLPSADDGGKDDIKGAIISKFDSAASLVNTPEAYNDLMEQKQFAVESGDKQLATELDNIKNSIDNKLIQTGKITPDEAAIYNMFSNYGEQKAGPGELQLGAGLGDKNREEAQEKLNSLNLSGKYDPSDILNIVEKVRNTIDNEINNIPEISRSYTAFSGFREGLGKGTIGAVQDVLNNDIKGANVSLVRNFTTDNKTQLRDYIDRKYKDFEHEDGDITYNRLEAFPTSGIGIDGNPLGQVVIYGENDEGQERKLGVELFTKGDRGWADYINTAKGLLETGIPEDQQMGQLMLAKAQPVQGTRIGSYIAKRNLSYLPDSGKKIDFAGLKGRVVNGKNSKFEFITDDGQRVPFNSENELVMEMHLNVIK